MKILVAVDGSDISLRAVKYAIQLSGRLAEPAKLTLLAVDPPLFPGVEKKIGSAAAQRLHDDNHEHMLAPARRALARAKLEVTERAEIGEIADTILAIAHKPRVDMIVMGSHGRTAVKGVLLGSVSSKVIAQTDVPVTIVR
ncbi:universal stress protein [Luteimonas sp. RD2P54]|uniref:Universal stress protein n=1 Tax=Luteimonas endophytica TaxID=3042023 RepID=A0ABT6J8T4_9GAMM|nr:universal stress protein [Luteimonas endophytica]MDH5823229.1 universal stress protein [Luteimonas endophytica]